MRLVVESTSSELGERNYASKYIDVLREYDLQAEKKYDFSGRLYYKMTIDVNTIEQLCDIVEKTEMIEGWANAIILQKHHDGTFSLEIYDYYRE